MISRFFIVRPIFAWVIAIAIMLFGLLALRQLPVSQYPQIAPTTVQINANYPGADATTVENSVTKVIEQGLTGLDGLQYISAASTSTGAATITLTFTNDTNPDIAQVQVQNKLQLVTPQLPQVVQQTGISVVKAAAGFLLVAAFVSSDGRLSTTDLADYIESTLNDTIKRVQGVGTSQIFGSGYAMRIWLNPANLQQFSLMPGDVIAAIQAQNVQISAGELGGLPQVKGQELNATVTALSRLQTVEQFENIILKSATAGSIVRLRDVARIELGAKSYTISTQYNGKPTAALPISLATGANALETAAAVKATIDRLKPTFPQGVDVVYPYDTTPFVRLSINEVVHTLFEAVVLVFVVMFVFLQNFRATLIPMIAVPVVLLGTLGVLGLAGFSINTLTMFAMVLAIGLLVDDAIVVVENVERVMREERLSAPEATMKSMDEITGALIGIAVVLSAVFVPMAFFGGSVGVIYRQFSVTIVTAMILSVVVALVLTPALCATILRSDEKANPPALFRWFNGALEFTTQHYGKRVAAIIARPLRYLLVFLLIGLGMGYLLVRLPSSFLPEEDQGVLFAIVQLPVGATQDRTLAVLDEIRRHYLVQEKQFVEGVLTVAGFSFSGQGQNVGIAFIQLKPFGERAGEEAGASAIAARATTAFKTIMDASVFTLAPPPIQGFGNNAGFEFYLEDTVGAGHARLMMVRDQLLALAAKSPLLAGTRPNGQDDTPQYAVEIDQEKAGAMALSQGDINLTLSAAWGSAFVNDFIDRGRVKSVYVQADAPFRMQPDDVDQWFVRNAAGSMVPFSAFSSGRWSYGSPRLERYNGVSAVNIQGGAAPGVSSGAAMNEIDRIARQLPTGFVPAWTGLSYQEQLSGNQAMALYGISILVVFLSLAALYESWSTPFAVLLCVPIGIFGALLAATIFGQSNDVYFKVGLLTTIGLAAKNAILIIEFAIDEEKTGGHSLVAATLEAARQRLRPILMTSLAFILGVVPLAVATGAGSGSQNAIGIGVLGGMLAATALGVFFVPLLYIWTRGLRLRANQAAKS